MGSKKKVYKKTPDDQVSLRENVVLGAAGGVRIRIPRIRQVKKTSYYVSINTVDYYLLYETR